MGLGMGLMARFETMYKCHSVAFIHRPELEYGGKSMLLYCCYVCLYVVVCIVVMCVVFVCCVCVLCLYVVFVCCACAVVCVLCIVMCVVVLFMCVVENEKMKE
jgi:hypothetical protein